MSIRSLLMQIRYV